MHSDRICDLADDLNNHVFEILDLEPELTGEDAQKVAHRVSEAFREAMQKLLDE